MVTLLSRDMKSEYEYLEVCTSGENSDLHPRDYSSTYITPFESRCCGQVDRMRKSAKPRE